VLGKKFTLVNLFYLLFKDFFVNEFELLNKFERKADYEIDDGKERETRKQGIILLWRKQHMDN
jgi:hypothetical protein